MNRRFDTVIIGGGIVGASAAYYLAKSGKSVVLVEKGRINGEQSSRGWGIIGTQGRNPLEIPLMLDSLEIWRGLEDELGDGVGWNERGQVSLFSNDSGRRRSEAFMAVARQFGLTTQLVGPKEVVGLLPHTKPQGCLGALYTPTDGSADQQLAATAFARAAAGYGAVIWENTAARAIDVWGEVVCGVDTEQGRLGCQNIVVAAGCWTSLLLKPLGISHPSLWIRGSVGRSTVVSCFVKLAVSCDKYAYLQSPDGRLNLAAVHEPMHDLMLQSRPELLRLHKLKQKKIKLGLGRPMVRSIMGDFDGFVTHRSLDPAPDLNALKRAADAFHTEHPATDPIQFERSWAGYMDYTPDELPIIEAVAEPRGLFVAAGLGSQGFGIAPAVGRSISDLIIRGDTDRDLSPFRSRRFGHD
ncbi:NAD(P)/FAD-dependent oxidoreductase [Mesorhizobium neociceri]|uniref:FAD-binding oxidoreductase n=1 Tax=Mesorhizobium neociceri TaxID=1307853 RepID=A0A838B9P4_9HYPH|nr:FAD-binding oxidoreductase [Mesorhizobium neociceri]MBA1142394.1 FAD-binding oxidoreductase [Mesorhizobium neociceri]